MTVPVTRVRTRTGRRLRYRSRSVAVSVALVALSLGVAFVAVEAVLALLGQPPLLSRPFELLVWASANASVSLAVAGALAVLGVVAVVVAMTPGRFRRRVIVDERMTFVVDDDVMASGISRAVAAELGVSRGQVRTSLARRRADVRVTPTTGFSVSSDSAVSAGTHVVEELGVRPAPRAVVTLERSGVLS